MSCQPFSSGVAPGLSAGGYQVQMSVADTSRLQSSLSKSGKGDPSGYDCTTNGCREMIKTTFYATDTGHFSQFDTLEACQKVCPKK